MTNSPRCAPKLFRFFLVLSVLCLVGIVYFFADTYYLRGLHTVRNAGDPRWRVFDYHSRPAAPDEIYAVADSPSVKSVRPGGRAKPPHRLP